MAKETISQTEGLCKEVANCIRNAYDRGYKQGFKDGNYNKEFFVNLIDDVWELVRKLRHPSYEGTYSDDEKRDIFGYVSSDSILTNLSASEAIKKVKEYEEKQKQANDKIKVGDEVYLSSLSKDYPRIVLSLYAEDDGLGLKARTMLSGGIIDIKPVSELKRTGRHFDQIAEVLEQLKEGQDETK